MFLPEGLLAHFRLDRILELGDVSTKKTVYHIYLTESNVLPIFYNASLYEPKGFYKEKTIQDFPIRGKAVYLVVKRRRWRHKGDGSQITSNFSFIAEGAKLTQELSDFLKGTGRDPGRYH